MVHFFGLPRNVETLDSRVRMVIGFSLSVGVMMGNVFVDDPAWVVLGVYLVITGLIRYDPFYSMLGIKKVQMKGEKYMDH